MGSFGNGEPPIGVSVFIVVQNYVASGNEGIPKSIKREHQLLCDLEVGQHERDRFINNRTFRCPTERRNPGSVRLRHKQRPTHEQVEMFDGHHKQHALAYLVIIGPDGMILWSAEPESGRRNDNFLVNINNLIRSPDGLTYDSVMERLHRVTGKRSQYYGDSAFANTQYSQSAFSQTGASQAQLHYNNIMNSVRVSIENVFGFVISKPAWCDYHKNQKLLLQHVGERESFSNAAFAGRTARTVNLGLFRPDA